MHVILERILSCFGAPTSPEPGRRPAATATAASPPPGDAICRSVSRHFREPGGDVQETMEGVLAEAPELKVSRRSDIRPWDFGR